jgi:ribonucleotide monophosphatase NagD (HAD superfamily)
MKRADRLTVLDGGSGTLSALDRRGTPFAIVTNDASRLPATYAARFARHGIRLAAEYVVTSGSLLPAYFRDHGWSARRPTARLTAEQ